MRGEGKGVMGGEGEGVIGGEGGGGDEKEGRWGEEEGIQHRFQESYRFYYRRVQSDLDIPVCSGNKVA